MDLGTYPYLWLVTIFIIVFFLMRLGVGIWAGRQVSNTADYVVAGRRLPVYMAAASIMTTWFAAETLMGASSTAYQYGFQGVIFDPFGASACLFLSGFLFIRMMRRAKYLTLVDFFERRYGKLMTALSCIAQLLTYFAWTGAQIVAGGSICHALFGWPTQIGMIIIITVVAAYTTMGGMLADTLLDFIQMFFTAGGITLIFGAMVNAVGGFSGMVNGASALYTSHPFTLLPTLSEGYLGYQGPMGWMYWIAAWMAVGLGSVATQDLMQRSMSARNQATSVYGSYFAGAMYLFFGIMSPLIGIMMFKLNPNIAPDETQFLLVTAALEHLTPVLTALFIAALVAALMSTSDSSLLAGASVVTENLIPLIIGRKLSDKGSLWGTRAMVVVNAIIGIIIALWAATIYELAVLAWSLLLVGLFVPFAFGMYWKKANGVGAAASFIGGFAVWGISVWFFMNHGIGGPSTSLVCEGDMDCAFWDAVYIGSFVATVASLLCMIIGSLLTQKSNPPKPILDYEGNPLESTFKLNVGWLPLKDALRKLRPEEYDD
jgi:solute:Na+ symporter, SSS family